MRDDYYNDHDPQHDPDAAEHEQLQHLLDTVRLATGDCSVEPDADGHIKLSHGSATIHVWLMYHGGYVRMLSPLLDEVQESPTLLGRLNELNLKAPLMRLAVLDATVYLMAELPARPFMPQHVGPSLAAFCAMADTLGGELQAEIGGLTALDEEMLDAPKH